MKRLFAFSLVIMLVLSLAACGEKAEWEKFIDDYNEWVDEYIELVEKYKANPNDLTILQSYTQMALEAAEWSSRADDIASELENSPSDANKFAQELLKISNKLAKALG